MIEETFAQTLSERDDVRLFFINENKAFTDGKNIVVDPAILGIYADEDALLRTGKYLGWPADVLDSTWKALSIITRALTIHECLHILYTDFPCHSLNDPICDTKNKKLVMAEISNIIEDAYIEAVGCSCFDNMEFYLKFIRVSQLFRSYKKSTKVINLKDALAGGNEVVIQKRKERSDSDRLKEYLGVMVNFLLYPWIYDEGYSSDIAEYVAKTKQYFLDGSAAASPDERYEYCQKVFDVIKHLIPDDEEEELSFDEIDKRLIGGKTHSGEGGIAGTAGNKGKSQSVTRRLFSGLNGEKIKSGVTEVRILGILDEISRNERAVGDIEGAVGVYLVIGANDTGATPVHKNIKIEENHPKINYDLRKAYKNIHSKYASVIRSYNSKFAQLLQAHMTVREEGFEFGNGITSKRLGNPHRKFWYRQQDGTDVPDISVMLLIDGSGSMEGGRTKAAMESAVILHEVLKNQGITHAVVEHRAHGSNPSMEVNILVDFDAKDDQKLNLLQLTSGGDNRDGLALYWAEKYIGKRTLNDYKLIIVLSDGLPAHKVDNYYPPVSAMDTANAVRKIKKRGTDIVAVSLDDYGSFDCYGKLSEIYPNLIACNDLSRLTGQLLGIIAKILQ